jgi:hypothetical protein
LLNPDERPIGLEKWYDRLAPLVDSGRERLREIEPSALAWRSGCARDADGTLRLTFFWHDYLVRLPDLDIRRAKTGEPPSSFVQSLILTYLASADGTMPSGRWIAYHDLPGGMFYAQAFRGYAEIRLVRDLGAQGLEAFCRGAERLGAKAIEIGSAGYAFQILPRVHLAAVYWLGDEELSAQASILFEDTATHYMPTDGLAILGSHLASAIVKAAQ